MNFFVIVILCCLSVGYGNLLAKKLLPKGKTQFWVSKHIVVEPTLLDKKPFTFRFPNVSIIKTK